MLATLDAVDVAASSITYAEVTHGILNSHPQQLDRAVALFKQIQVLPFDAVAGAFYARLPFRRARFDRLIAAHALALDATLVTNDVRDFADIPNLKIENWAA